MPRLKPYSRSAPCCSGVDVAEHAADLRAAGEQIRRLAADDVEVLVLGDLDVAVLGQLVELAFDHPQRDVTQQPHDLERVLRQRHRHRLDVEEVAEQHRDVVAPLRVHGQPAAALLGIVDDVVVDQRRGVDELDDGRVEDGAVAGDSRTGAPPSAAPPGGRACRRSLDVLADLGDERRPATGGAGRTRARPSEVVAHRLEQSESRSGGGLSTERVQDAFNLTIVARGVSTRRVTAVRAEQLLGNSRSSAQPAATAVAAAPRCASRARRHATTHAGSLRLPRCGTGARNGLSVSTSSRSVGHEPRRPRAGRSPSGTSRCPASDR